MCVDLLCNAEDVLDVIDFFCTVLIYSFLVFVAAYCKLGVLVGNREL